MARNLVAKLVAVGVVVLVVLPTVARANTTDSTTYGSGTYGYCDYGSCTITLTSNGAVSLDVSPTGAGVCTIQSDSVSVLTDNTTGYTLQLANSTTSTTMANGGDTIASTTGTYASPAVLAPNAWGFRVDSNGSFGAGPTGAVSNVSSTSLTFAKVPASNVTPVTLVNSSSPANPAEVTTAWYGLCVNTTVPSGTYSAQVTYTAVTN